MEKRNPKAGFLPLYIKLYDEKVASMRAVVDPFVADTAKKVEALGIDLVVSPICRVHDEFAAAVKKFEEEDVDFILLLYPAYSPSLESADVLVKTKLPLLILDTTYDYEFTPLTYADGMLYNHGVQGPMDGCNMLKKGGKAFDIVAGYFGKESPDYERMCARIGAFAKAARVKHALSAARVGLVGEQFVGMGDFRIPFDLLKKTLGVTVVEYDQKKGKARHDAITQDELDAEYKTDCERFEVRVDRKIYDPSTRASLAVRKWVKDEKLDGFTMNFNSACVGTGFPTMPFAEASIAMGERIGYAGEGDVLTAAFVSSLMSVFPEVSFTEVFCPDWKGGSLFLSHMGEYNVALSDPERKPIMSEKEFVYGDSFNPTIVLAPFKPGRCVYVSFNPGKDGSYSLFYAAGEMLKVPFENQQSYVVNGWFKPDMPLPAFLEENSRAGGIHHAALIYDNDGDAERVLKALDGLFA